MSILAEIMRSKQRHLSGVITAASSAYMRDAAHLAPPPRDFIAALQADTVQVIAEIKRASPSQGAINAKLDVSALAAEYERNGAAAISVLTDEDYFGGSIEDLRQARDAANLPLLRKDFIISEYQIYEARAAGADAALLIVAALDPPTLEAMLKLTHELGMAALVEAHTHQELDIALAGGARLVGINNRNLNTLEVSLDTFMDLAQRVPPECTLVSESGIYSRADVEYVAQSGAEAVLVGTRLVAAGSPGAALKELLGIATKSRHAAGV